jgi:hypothetical protein
MALFPINRRNCTQFYCVNNGPLNQDGAQFSPPMPNVVKWPFLPGGEVPSDSNQLCSN